MMTENQEVKTWLGERPRKRHMIAEHARAGTLFLVLLHLPGINDIVEGSSRPVTAGRLYLDPLFPPRQKVVPWCRGSAFRMFVIKVIFWMNFHVLLPFYK